MADEERRKKGRNRGDPVDDPKKKKRKVKQPGVDEEAKPEPKKRRQNEDTSDEAESGKKKKKKNVEKAPPNEEEGGPEQPEKQKKKKKRLKPQDGSEQPKAEDESGNPEHGQGVPQQAKAEKQRKMRKAVRKMSGEEYRDYIAGLVNDHKELKELLPVEAYDTLGFEVVARHMSKKVHLISEARALHREIIRPFKGLSSEEALKQLSDPSYRMTLPLPSSWPSPHSPRSNSSHETFTYVGRPVFTSLLKKMERSPKVQLRGHPGRGKSYLLAAMACYLHTYGKTYGNAAYILTSQMVGNFGYLVEALLLAYARDLSKQLEILARSASEETLWECFTENKLEPPVILMDEVEELDNYSETAASTLEERIAARRWLTEFFERGVSCASDNSTFQPLDRMDFASYGFPFILNRPFDMDEVAGWLSAKNLCKEDSQEQLIYYTGLLPRHLEHYTMHKKNYLETMEERMDTFMWKLVTDKDEKDVREVLNGEVEKLNGRPLLDRTLFYERPSANDATENATIVCVLPFLEAKLRAEMDKRRTEKARRQQRDEIMSRITCRRSVMQLELEKEEGLANAPLVGWLAEGIAKDCMLLHRQCFDRMTFTSSVAYTGTLKEKELDRFTEEDLKNGVLFYYPTEGTARNADFHYVTLLDDGVTLEVKAIQMSVSAWSLRKGSHVEWEEKEKENWKRDGCTTDARFIYVLSNALRESEREDFGNMPDWVSVRWFEDVHESLKFLDELKVPECSRCHECKNMK